MAMQFEQLITPVTVDDARTSIYLVLERIGVNTTGWKPGAVVRTIITAVATLFSAFTAVTSQVARAGFLELSSGDWLEAVGKYNYGVERIGATFASGKVTLSNQGGGVYSFDPGDLVVANPSTGKAYRNTGSFTLAALQTGLVVDVQAIESGSASTSSPNTVTTLETALNGVTVTNATSIIGRDAEADADYRLRCAEKTEALSPNGPADAYAFFARSSVRSDGSAVGVTRVRVIKNSTIGTVTVVCASASGPVDGTAWDATTDLGIVNRDIQSNVVPIGITASVVSAERMVVPVAYEVWIYSAAGLSDAAVKSTVASAVTAFLAARPLGGDGFSPALNIGTLFASALRAAIIDAHPMIFNAVVSSPAADITMGYASVAVPGAITCTAVHQVTL